VEFGIHDGAANAGSCILQTVAAKRVDQAAQTEARAVATSALFSVFLKLTAVTATMAAVFGGVFLSQHICYGMVAVWWREKAAVVRAGEAEEQRALTVSPL